MRSLMKRGVKTPDGLHFDRLRTECPVGAAHQLSSGIGESRVANACRNVSAALADLMSQTLCDAKAQDLDGVEVARMRLEFSLTEARIAPCGDDADVRLKILLHQDLSEWAGEEDTRVRLFERQLLWEMSERFLQGDRSTSVNLSRKSASVNVGKSEYR